jgi:hypothetical protein
MKMKKLVICIMAVFLSLTFIPIQASTNSPKPATTLTPEKTAELKAIELRISEIKSMDKTKLNASEKKSLRKEAKGMKKKAQTDYGYEYYGGLFLLILLLLILLV